MLSEGCNNWHFAIHLTKIPTTVAMMMSFIHFQRFLACPKTTDLVALEIDGPDFEAIRATDIEQH